MTTSHQIKAARTALGDSQAAFGARLGVDQSTVHRWETEGPPKRGAAKMLISQLLETLSKQKRPVREAAE